MTSSRNSSLDQIPSPNNESLPTNTSEIGTLRKLPNHVTGPAVEDICGGEEEVLAEGGDSGPVRVTPMSTKGLEKSLVSALGVFPYSKTASELVMSFFKTWHPLFPFLHGPKFLQDIESLYADRKSPPQVHSGLET
jgi:hypothetical protein